MTRSTELILCGLPISKGVGIGEPLFLASSEMQAPEVALTHPEIEHEILRYRKALCSSRTDLETLQKKSVQEGEEEVGSILASHLEMIQDPMMTEGIEEKIRSKQCNTESIFYHLIHEYKVRFSSLKDSYFQERVRDIIDVSHRVLGHLHPLKSFCIKELSEKSILFAHELIPSHAVEADPTLVRAFVSTVGGVTSHAAIIARAKGIPYVANVDLQQIKELALHKVLVDGSEGLVILNPTKQTQKKYERRILLQEEQEGGRESIRLRSETRDGYEIKVLANIENASGATIVKKQGISGVGLFRSEYLFLSKGKFPTEEEQYQIYREMAENLCGLPLTLRMFDLGGDKKAKGPLAHTDAKYFADLEHEPNPVLGCRAIRLLLRHPDLLHTQLRAILRASCHGNVRILIPMISDVSEIQLVRKKLTQVQKELKQEGILIPKKPLLGCMLEVPASVIMCDVLSQYVDFFSIGTNDLVQYVLAADRANSHTSELSLSSHPSILRMIQMIVNAASLKNKPVILCGECASDPLLLPVFIGLGIREFSVAICHVPLISQVIRKWKILEANRLAQSALEIPSAKDLRKFLEKQMQEKSSV